MASPSEDMGAPIGRGDQPSLAESASSRKPSAVVEGHRNASVAELRASLGLENIIGQKRPAKKTAPEPVPQAPRPKPAIVEEPRAEQKADEEDELEAFLRSQGAEPEPVAQPVAAPVPAEPVDELAAFLAQTATEAP